MDAEVPIKTVHAKGTGVGAVAFFVREGFEGMEVDGGQMPASGMAGGAYINCLGRVHVLTFSCAQWREAERRLRRRKRLYLRRDDNTEQTQSIVSPYSITYGTFIGNLGNLAL